MFNSFVIRKRIYIIFTIFILIIFVQLFNFRSVNIYQTQKRLKITKIIHQSWKTRNIPSKFTRYYRSWKQCFPNWEYKFWTDEDNRNFVSIHFPWFLSTYNSFPAEIYRADVSRYLYMFYYGGIYTDLDNECLTPFEHLLENYTFVFGRIDKVPRRTVLPENYVQNSFMYSKPKQLFWLELILDVIVNSNNSDPPDELTGPTLLCNGIYNYRNRFPMTHGIKIYDAWYFNPLSWGGVIKYKYCKLFVSMTDEEWKLCREGFVKNGSFVVQYHSHVW